MPEYLKHRRTLLGRIVPDVLSAYRRLQPPTTAPVPLPPLKLAGRISYTFDQFDGSNFLPNVSSPMTKGANWKVWVDAVSKKIAARSGNQAEIVESAPGQDSGTVHFTGEAVFDLAALFDVVFLPTSPPREHAIEIRSRSLQNTQIVYGPYQFESVQQSRQFNDGLVGLRDLSKANPVIADLTSGCASDGLNEYGCFDVDRNEALDRSHPDPCIGSTWPNGLVDCVQSDASLPTRHYWACRIDTAYATQFASTLAQFLVLGNHMTLEGFLGGSLHGVCFADMFESPQAGTATNTYPSDYTKAAYVGAWSFPNGTGWRGMLGKFRNITEYVAVWAEATDSLSTYGTADIDRRVLGDFFLVPGTTTQRTFGQLQTAIQTVLGAGCQVVLGGVAGSGVDSWYTGAGPGLPYGTWGLLHAKVSSIVGGVDRCFVQAASTNTGGFLMWQPEFRKP